MNTIGDELLGPLLNSDLLDMDNAHLYLLDGIDLGRRADLMIQGRDMSRWKDRPRKPSAGPQKRAKYS